MDKALLADNRTLSTIATLVEKDQLDRSGRNPEWEQLNAFDFFRRTTVFYIHDRQLLRAYFVSSLHMYKSSHQAYTMHVLMDDSTNPDRNYTLKMKHVRMKLHWHHFKQSIVASLDWYNLDLVDAFNVKYDLSLQNESLFNGKLTFKLFIRDEETQLVTRHPLYVQIKKQRSPRKSGSLLCTYCYFYGNADSKANYLTVWHRLFFLLLYTHS